MKASIANVLYTLTLSAALLLPGRARHIVTLCKGR
jgi:hypothetical protein